MSLPWALTNDEVRRICRWSADLCFEDDRAQEVAEYFGCSLSDVQSHPAVRDKDSLHSLFSDVSRDPALFENYRMAQMPYVARLMVRYNRFDKALALARVVSKTHAKKSMDSPMTMIDYGCGVADFGLLFFILGWDVVLVDIAGGNLDFARCRFEKRGWPARSVGVTEHDLYPELPSSDLIVAGEVLEHVRDPLATCRYLEKSLKPGGLLWVSGFPFVSKKLEGDHLPEAIDLADATKEWLDRHMQASPHGTSGVRHFTGRLFRKLG